MSESLVRVIPAPDLPPTRYVRGIPASGKAIPRSMAEPLIEAGLVVVLEPPKPASKPSAPKETD